ncbi:unnamed protein product [Somion occarium]|uniref:BTB domain-containing protein n=1 Tax=Somion occarium TaxID=3059160 RepID=A0ABP1DSJ6_9APHY
MSSTPSTRPQTPLTSFSDSEDLQHDPHVISDENEETLTHDPKYYLDDEMTIFLVERRLFKVHRHFLIRESDFFRTLFQLPTGVNTRVEGRSDDLPIPLPGVKVDEFISLLDFFYEGMHAPQLTADSDISCIHHWSRILSISTRFSFDRIREMAIEQLSPHLDPISKICLARTYDIEEWLFPAYEQICQRDNALEAWEAELIGLRTARLLAQTREELHRSRDPWREVIVRDYSPSPGRHPSSSSPPPFFSPSSVKCLLGEVFPKSDPYIAVFETEQGRSTFEPMS